MPAPLESRPAAPAWNTPRTARTLPPRGVTVPYQPPPCLAGGAADTSLAAALGCEEAFAGEAGGGAVAFVSSQATNWERATPPRIANKRAGTPILFMGRMAP
jgi:hypothetical protein